MAEVISRFAGTAEQDGLLHEVVVKGYISSDGDSVVLEVSTIVGPEKKTSTITIDNNGSVTMETAFSLGGHGGCIAMCATNAVLAIVRQCWNSRNSLSDFYKCLKRNGVKNAAAIAQCVAKCFSGGGVSGEGDGGVFDAPSS